MNLTVKIFDSVEAIPAEAWNSLPGARVMLSHGFLHALEASGCATAETGWQPAFLTVWEEEKILGGLPLYFKSNSWGEFVFDWGWADAYERSGLQYYPKLVSSVPFVPVTGSRLLAEDSAVRDLLLRAALGLAKETKVSSLHLLFPHEPQAREMEAEGLMLRNTVQFHWLNQGYRSFDDFLAGLKHDKRKKIKQERRKVAEAGITFRRLRGTEITDDEWQFFNRCYLHTHELYQSPPSLNLDFFRRIGKAMPENLFLILGERGGELFCSALNFLDEEAAYGRWWGALDYVPGLHFETCYYQALDFCIENKIGRYEGGAQGEHKLARGLLPVTTWSAHWLAHPQFSQAVEDFLARETSQIGKYVDELGESSPFRRA